MILFDELVTTERLRSTVIGLAGEASVEGSIHNDSPLWIMVEYLRESMLSRSIPGP